MKTDSEIYTDISVTDTKESEELIERTDIPDSPFTIIGIEGEYFGAMGKYRLTEKSTSKELIKAELTQISWNRIMQVLAIVIENRNKFDEINKELEIV